MSSNLPIPKELRAQIEPFAGKMAIILRSGVPVWVSEEIGRKFQASISEQGGHRLLFINELQRTINTADVSDVCGPDQYADYIRVKRGEWQCPQGNWHGKRQDGCDCKKSVWAKLAQVKRDREDAELNRPRTPEEQKLAVARIERFKKKLVAQGIIPKKT